MPEISAHSLFFLPKKFPEAMRDGRVKKGDLLACCGFGAGLTWGGAVPWCRGGAEGGDAV